MEKVIFVTMYLKTKKLQKKKIEIYKKNIPGAQYLPEKAILNELLENRLFANAFLKDKNHIDDNTTIILNFAIEKALASLYIKRLKKQKQPDEKALKSFYLDHIDSFKPMPIVSISTIAVDSLKKADEIYIKIKKNPKLFEELAKKESIDPSASNGGHYKNVPIITFAPEVREWIRKHKVGDVSEPIKVGRFYYIDRIDKKKKTDISYKSLKEDIKKILINVYIAEKIKEEFKKLKEEEGIK